LVYEDSNLIPCSKIDVKKNVACKHVRVREKSVHSIEDSPIDGICWLGGPIAIVDPFGWLAGWLEVWLPRSWVGPSGWLAGCMVLDSVWMYFNGL
jgi:hypothetical protein